MGREQRANHARWQWLYERGPVRRIWIAVRFFYTARRRARLHGQFWGWLTGRWELPKGVA
jgi:hypothetical protein